MYGGPQILGLSGAGMSDRMKISEEMESKEQIRHFAMNSMVSKKVRKEG